MPPPKRWKSPWTPIARPIRVCFQTTGLLALREILHSDTGVIGGNRRYRCRQSSRSGTGLAVGAGEVLEAPFDGTLTIELPKSG